MKLGLSFGPVRIAFSVDRGSDAPRHANMMLSKSRAFSNVAVDRAREGSAMFGFSRYLHVLESAKTAVRAAHEAGRTLQQSSCPSSSWPSAADAPSRSPQEPKQLTRPRLSIAEQKCSDREVSLC